jgi:hypothetical protein
MKRIAFLFLVLALVLTACGAPTPVTIVITAVPPTNEPAAVATEVPPVVVPTDTLEPVVAATDTLAPAAPTDTPKPGVAPTNTKPPAVGGAVFTDITRDIDAFSLKCSPSQLNFSLTSINPAITGAIVYYRVYDKNSTLKPPALIAGPNMVGDKKGHFTLEFSALNINPDMRNVATGWFDYQFVGLNKVGNVVGRSDMVVKQVTYTLECP